jgi:hypothetical protein
MYDSLFSGGRMRNLLWILLLTFFLSVPAWARVRKVEVTQDQITTVRTALGIATIIQVPDHPSSIVVGDQASFKVEYLDQAITIKPLRAGAKSNLYIYTDFRRFNVQLVTVAEAAADYIVYLENPIPKLEKSSVHWIEMRKSAGANGLAFTLDRMAATRDGVLLFEFHIAAKNPDTLRPDWFWLIQTGDTRPIQNLFLSSLAISPSAPVSGSLQVFRTEVDEKAAMRLELRREKTVSLLIPKVASWKQQGHH